MTWPDDNFLPAKSVIDDSPPGSDIRFYQNLFEQLEGLRLMINERRVLTGYSIIPAFTEPVSRKGTTGAIYAINTLRVYAEQCIRQNGSGILFFLNTDVHPSGDIEDATTLTYWTKATIFSSLGIGVGGDWTRIPARNPWGKSASSGNLARGDVLYKEHVNEIYQFIHVLRYFTISGTQVDRIERQTDTVVQPDITSAASAALAHYPTTSWGQYDWESPLGSWNTTPISFTSIGTIGLAMEKIYRTLGPVASIGACRGKLQFNLSGYTGATAKIYLQVAKNLFGLISYELGGNSPVAITSGWHYYIDATPGSIYTTPYVSEAESTTPTVPDDPPLPPPTDISKGIGWRISDQTCVVSPAFLYP